MIDEKLWARINYFWYNGGMKSQNEQELIALGKQLGQRLEKQDVVILTGDLGAGKTTFTKRICKEYNIHENIKSPTFTYVIEYTSGDVTVYHFDAYRIINPEEIYEIGFEDYIGEENTVVIVEWADNIIDEMPEHTVYIEISYNDETSRKISMYKLKNGEKEYVDFCNNNNN